MKSLWMILFIAVPSLKVRVCNPTSARDCIKNGLHAHMVNCEINGTLYMRNKLVVPFG